MIRDIGLLAIPAGIVILALMALLGTLGPIEIPDVDIQELEAQATPFKSVCETGWVDVSDANNNGRPMFGWLKSWNGNLYRICMAGTNQDFSLAIYKIRGTQKWLVAEGGVTYESKLSYYGEFLIDEEEQWLGFSQSMISVGRESCAQGGLEAFQPGEGYGQMIWSAIDQILGTNAFPCRVIKDYSKDYWTSRQAIRRLDPTALCGLSLVWRGEMNKVPSFVYTIERGWHPEDKPLCTGLVR